MNIQYTYKIINVDKEARCMEVVYSADGHQTMHIGARMPYVGESLEAVVNMYAPVAYWAEQAQQVLPVAQGTAGVFTPSALDTSLPAVKARKLETLAAARYGFETSGIRVSGAAVGTDRQSQSMLSSALSAVQSGIVQTVDWKGPDGVWAQLGFTDLQAIAEAVAGHVQNAFSIERQLATQVAAATTIEAVEAIQWPV